MTAPMRVGVLHDMVESTADETAMVGQMDVFLRMPIDDLVQRGRLDREVEFVHAAGLGLPVGTAFAIERAFDELVAQGVLLIVGPAVGDNALVATVLADAARVPTINWAGTERARSEFMFHLQVGSHEDESVLLARHVQSLGVQRVGVVFDRSPIGRRYASFFESECETLGVGVSTRARSRRSPPTPPTSWRPCARPGPMPSSTWDSVSWAPRSRGRGPQQGGTCPPR